MFEKLSLSREYQRLIFSSLCQCHRKKKPYAKKNDRRNKQNKTTIAALSLRLCLKHVISQIYKLTRTGSKCHKDTRESERYRHCDQQQRFEGSSSHGRPHATMDYIPRDLPVQGISQSCYELSDALIISCVT